MPDTKPTNDFAQRLRRHVQSALYRKNADRALTKWAERAIGKTFSDFDAFMLAADELLDLAEQRPDAARKAMIAAVANEKTPEILDLATIVVALCIANQPDYVQQSIKREDVFDQDVFDDWPLLVCEANLRVTGDDVLADKFRRGQEAIRALALTIAAAVADEALGALQMSDAAIILRPELAIPDGVKDDDPIIAGLLRQQSEIERAVFDDLRPRLIAGLPRLVISSLKAVADHVDEYRRKAS